MKRIKSAIIITAFCIMVPLVLHPQNSGSAGGFYLDHEFYNEFAKVLPILRDDLFESKINSVLHCRGTVVAVGEQGRYRKAYRVVLRDEEALKLNLTLTFYVFFDNKETYSMITKDSGFELTGQLMSYTPLNVKRDNYILDIVLEKGSLVLDK